jgi:hypothetical protein
MRAHVPAAEGGDEPEGAAEGAAEGEGRADAAGAEPCTGSGEEN